MTSVESIFLHFELVVGDEDNFDTFKECNEYLKKKMNDLQEDLEDKDRWLTVVVLVAD